MHTDRPTWRPRLWAVAVGVVLVLAMTLMTVGIDQPMVAWVVALLAVASAGVVIAWTTVQTRAQRLQYEADLAAWAADRAIQSERLRIASDLHDLVSHGLGVITVRAAVGRRTRAATGDAERVEALADIERVSRETTTELRRMLGLLRAPGAAPLRPADTLDDLPGIVRQATASGLRVALDVGELGDVSPGAQLTICAVVREALHNTLRHAGPTDVRVRVSRSGEAITVDVHDAGPDGMWLAHRGAGHGLDALRQRLDALGGRLDAGPDKGGFGLIARFPDGPAA